MKYEKIDELKILIGETNDKIRKSKEKYSEESNPNEEHKLVIEGLKSMNTLHDLQVSYIKELEKAHPHFMKKNKKRIR